MLFHVHSFPKSPTMILAHQQNEFLKARFIPFWVLTQLDGLLTFHLSLSFNSASALFSVSNTLCHIQFKHIILCWFTKYIWWAIINKCCFYRFHNSHLIHLFPCSVVMFTVTFFHHLLKRAKFYVPSILIFYKWYTTCYNPPLCVVIRYLRLWIKSVISSLY